MVLGRNVALLLLLACFLSAPLLADEETPAEQQDQVISQESTIRKIGYNVGDIARQKVVVVVPAEYRLDPNSLPVMGKGSGQFELRATRMDTSMTREGRRYDFEFDWQIFQVLPEVKPYLLMPLNLQFRHGDRVLEAHIDRPSVMVSSFLPLAMGADDLILQADIAAPIRETRQLTRGFALALAVLLISIVYFAWYFDWLRMGWHDPRPFRKACRQIRNISKSDSPAQQSQAAMRILRRAFDASAETALSIETLDRLFAHKSQLIPLRNEIEAFYMESERAFFSGDRQAEDVRALGRFGRKLRALETT